MLGVHSTKGPHRMKIAYISCAALPEPDIDEQPLVDALYAAGHDASVAAWDDPSVDWSQYDLAIVRATWNYALHVDAFAAWLERVDSQTTLVNPYETLTWNLHKGYLQTLCDAGVAIIPTRFAQQGESASVAAIAEDEAWSKIVIKPSVSAGSFGTKCFDLGQGEQVAAQAFFDEMNAQRDMMIQRYMPSVDTQGETALIVINSQLTHAIEKRPRFDDQDEEVYLREHISDEMRELATKVLDAAGQEHYYARVDVIPDDDGTLMLSELELLEPSLFFPYAPHAIDAFVGGLEQLAAKSTH